jgi:hypothetical protein
MGQSSRADDTNDRTPPALGGRGETGRGDQDHGGGKHPTRHPILPGPLPPDAHRPAGRVKRWRDCSQSSKAAFGSRAWVLAPWQAA